MIPANDIRSPLIRRSAALIAVGFCCIFLSTGCGESSEQQSTLPKDFAEKLEKEHPELFVRKVGKKTEILGGRDKRAVIREEWQKSQQKGAE